MRQWDSNLTKERHKRHLEGETCVALNCLDFMKGIYKINTNNLRPAINTQFSKREKGEDYDITYKN